MMIARLARLALALLMPFALASCVLAPGKFVSTLRIDADRHFTFTYVGEVIALRYGDDMTKGFGDAAPADKTDPPGDGGDAAPTLQKLGFQADDEARTARRKPPRRRRKPTARTGRSPTRCRRRRAIARSPISATASSASTMRSRERSTTASSIRTISMRRSCFRSWSVEVRANNTVRVKAPGYRRRQQREGRAGCSPRRRASSTASSRWIPMPRSSARTTRTAR